MHDGDVSGFSSRLFLLPEHNLGFFVCNNTSNSILRMELTDHLMSRYFKRPQEPPLKQTTADVPSVGKRLTGCYRTIRIGLDSFDKLSYTGAVWKITENTVNSLIEIEPGLFQFPKSKTKMTYREDDNGNIKYLHMDAKQMPITYEKLAWYENYLRFPLVWFGIFAVVFFWIGLIRPVFYRIRSRRKTIIGTSNLVKYTKLSATVISDIYLIFIVGFTPAFILSEEQIGFGIPWAISALLVLPLINLVLTAVFIIFFIRSWKYKYWDLKKRLYYVLMALLFIGFAFCLNYWNLLGFQY